MKLANIDLKGLNTYASHRSVQENYLLDCNNVVCDKAGVISTRRGFSFLDDALVNCKKIFSAIQNIFVNADSKLYYDGGGTFTQVTFPNTSTIDANDSNQKIQIEDQNKSLYFNGKRVSSETNNPIDKKIKKLSTVTSNVMNAGLEAPINLALVASASGSFAANESIAVRVFYQYTDENNYLVTSPVSERVVGINDTGAAAKFTLSFQIPNQLMDRPVNIYYAVSNTVTNPVVPDDNLFWGTNTLVTSAVNINSGLNSVFTVSEIIERTSISDPVDLYTNSQQQGILQNNDPPVCSVDLETYQGYTFYGNLIDRLLKRVYSIDIPINGVAIVLDGISYTRKATSNYAAHEFSGTTTAEQILDLCRCVTATQTKYKMSIEPLITLGIEIWTPKAQYPVTGLPWYIKSTHFGVRIYCLQEFYGGGFGNTVLQIYNTTTSTWEPDSAAASDISSLSCVGAYNGKVYVLAGGDSYGGYTISATTKIYDIVNNSWTTGTTFPGSPAYGQMSCVDDTTGIIYVFGGFKSTGSISAEAWSYDTNTDTWTALTNITAGKYSGGCVYDNGSIYVIAGFSALNTTTATMYRYDIGANTWSTMTAMTAARGACAAAVKNGAIYVTGGTATGTWMDNSMTPPDYWATIGTGTNTMYVYSIGGASWSTSTDTILESIWTHDMTVVGNAMYIVGGMTTNNTYRFAGTNFVDNNYATLSERYQFGGVYALLQERFIGEGVDIPYTSSYISDENFTGSTSPLYRFEQKNTVQFSKQGQPEAVPFFNNFQCGSASYDILRLSALRSSLMILKTDGIYQLNGVSPETFSVQQLDPTFVLIAPQSLAKLNNEIYCLTNKGVVAINESGAKIISYPIKDLIDYDVAQVANLKTDINGTAYEDDYRYILTINDKTYTYNYVSDQWTIWFSGKSDIASWTVFNSNLYYLDSTRAYKERKTLTSADFQDENNAGIDASIKFNNLELNPGNMMDVIAMQILQRTQSNLTASITPDNNFNSGTLFTQLLDKYVVRVMFPNECRKAFYFRPLIEWNTEVAATPGTFSDLQLEGLDFDYDETQSNIK